MRKPRSPRQHVSHEASSNTAVEIEDDQDSRHLSSDQSNGHAASVNSLEDESGIGQRTLEPPTKRKRVAPSTNYARRKRAATACEFCRVRKTKCDNARPACTYCQRHRARCVYADADGSVQEVAQGSMAPVGITGQQILERLDEIKELLQTSSPEARQKASAVLASPSATRYSGPEQIATLSPQSDCSFSSRLPDELPSQDKLHREPPYHKSRCESVLKWPVFQSILSDQDRKITSFPFEASSTAGQRPDTTSASSNVMNDNFVSLCATFLSHVHHRNPILRSSDLMRLARNVEEYGLKWDSGSCLVLLACALAAYTRPWSKSLHSPPAESNNPDKLSHSGKMDDWQYGARAEAYYLAAKKRLGLLGHSIQDIQCFFFAHMYEKFAFRPIEARFQIQQASSRLHAYLQCRKETPYSGFMTDSPDQHLEQRLFWSCYRAEGEFLLEMEFQSSGLEKLSYPDAFPVPPQNLGSNNLEVMSPGSPAEVEQSRILEQKSWAYYLAEISLRRTIDTTIHSIYSRGEQSWLSNPSALVRQCQEHEQQISVWHRHVPAVVQFNEHEIPDDELTILLRGRFLEWREFVLRPVLYFVMHEDSRYVSDEMAALAHKAIDLCRQIIMARANHYRHGGSCPTSIEQGLPTIGLAPVGDDGYWESPILGAGFM
ncbi:ABC-transporter-regulating transcription factor [Paramyrothecium foliicola]|nr:ABC-transporter-regulating transcription factor [Paramyrothecium foliicola]